MMDALRTLLATNIWSRLGWATAALLLSLTPALAGSNSVTIEIANDRDPHDFGVPKDMKYEISGAHRFENGVFVGGLFQYTDPTSGGSDSQNLEASVGYRLPLSRIWTIDGSAGIGGRFDPASSNLPTTSSRSGLRSSCPTDGCGTCSTTAIATPSTPTTTMTPLRCRPV